MDDETITISISREAAHYLSMLLGDQLLSLNEAVVTEQIKPIQCAYEHAAEEIERALSVHIVHLSQRDPEKTTQLAVA